MPNHQFHPPIIGLFDTEVQGLPLFCTMKKTANRSEAHSYLIITGASRTRYSRGRVSGVVYFGAGRGHVIGREWVLDTNWC